GPGEGTSDWWDRLEQQRMDALSFDPYETHAGWYRQWIEIPKEYSGRRLSLQFDAVAMRCEVWYNGQHVGGHVGMFAPLEIELPAEATRFGAKNLVTVFVSDAAWQGEGNPNEILGTAVTVEVTREMLQSLPRGMYKRSAGIWQPVRLISTEPAHMADVFVKTASDGFAADIAISGTEGDGWHVRGTVIDPATDIGLAQVEAEVTGETATLEATGIAPRTWSPDDPNLYPLRLELTSPTGEVTDAIEQQIGFRTFEVRGNRLYLNDRPYWLRGANHAPSGLSPNDGEVARSFMRGMHDGNTVVLRAHGSSFTPTWLTAADEYGVGVCMEGVWPWVMGDDADPPTDELLAIWESEWTGVMRRLRNHPSILLWTLNNESYWYRAKDPELRKRKWEIATRMIRNMREIDPTRPIVCDSGYVRDPETYAAEIEPNGFDDGDIDDAHLYYGWYWPSPWHLYPDPAADPDAPAPLEERFSGARPAISQEFATGYPNNDTGHPTRKYIDKYYVPQAWVGDYAYEDRDPSVFLDRHAWLAKELTEVARRHRDRLCGKLHFSNSNWFRFPFLPESHEPYPAYEAMRLAMAPILVSADLRRRHFYEGESIECDVYVINDSPDGLDLPSSRLEASIVQPGGVPLVRAAAQVAPVGYYDKHVVSITLPVPDKLGEPERNDYELQLVLKIGETELARNAYPMVGADSEWAGRDAVIQAAVEPLTAGEGGTLVARGRDGIDALKARPELQQFVEGGGRVLIMNAGEHVARLLPEVIVSEVPWRPEIVNFEDEASPILDGLEPWDICWFNGEPGEIPVAATGGFLLKPVDGVRVLATAIRPHGYLAHPTDVQDHTAAVVFEAQLGKGKVIVSELDTAAAVTDPIAARVVSNLLKYLGDGE
ncbi:MAG TPA: glycoside hydrolase family 2 TIM barrel-domain containing protein, partial [Armatimonadota bacterium]|nr:glycoside hydrolase family 2 TIM barrel-domain containing protein [Armatimonadota bacterium]